MVSRVASLLAALLPGVWAAVTPPSADPFYTPTGDWQSQKPGAILNHRDIPNKIPMVNYTAAYQLLYRTTDSLGNATAAVTTVIIPETPDYSKLLSYQIVYDTPDVDCSPSYSLQEGGAIAFDNGYTYGLGEGWIVNSPDYEGPKAAFTAGIISGQATLDSIRAALASTSITKLQSNATVALWGYSGGALASQWAVELQHAYAPELNISGAAMGGLTPNVSSVALSVNNKSDAGLIAAGILGIAAAYPNLTSIINSSFVSTEKMNDFYAVKSECINQIGTNDANMDILGYFKQGESLLSNPDYQFAIQDGGIMGIHGTPEPSTKLYFYKSTMDEISPVADTDALFEKYCSQGVTIQYHRDAFGTHAEEAINGGLGALEFLSAIFTGSFKQVGCVEETVNSSSSVISSTSIAPTTPPYSVTASATTTAGGSGASATGASGASGSSGSKTMSGPAATITVAPQMIALGVVGGMAAWAM